MKSALRIAILAGLLVVLGIGIYRQQQAAPGEKPALSTDTSTMDESSAVLEDASTTVADSTTARQKRRAKAKDDPERKKSKELLERLKDVVLKNPAIRNLAASQIEQQIDIAYADYFKTLPADQAKALRALLAAKQLSALDLQFEAMQEDLSKEDRKELFDKMREQWENNRKQMEELLGEDGLQKLSEYEQSAQDRAQMTGLKEAMYGAGLDLNDAQARALIDMMRAARERQLTADEDAELYALSTKLPEERNITQQEAYLRWQELFHNRYMDGAAGILSPAQLAVFEQYLDQQLDIAESFADFKPESLPESTDRAPVELGRNSQTLSTPVNVPAHDTHFITWGDNQSGSSLAATKTANNTLEIDARTGSGWGCGITFSPSYHAKNSDGSIDASGARQIAARIRAPAGATLRFGLIESGADWPNARRYNGVNGADGEGFRHEGISTAEGWQTYTVPLSEFRLLGGYGNQAGNRIIDVQALRGVEILFPGGQADTVIEVDWIRLQ